MGEDLGSYGFRLRRIELQPGVVDERPVVEHHAVGRGLEPVHHRDERPGFVGDGFHLVAVIIGEEFFRN